MNILVFGKTGQVASELGRYHNVNLLGREHADLSNPESCRAEIEKRSPDAVINAAAYTAVDQAEIEEEIATRINGDAPGAVARVCAERNIPFVQISTDYVFDGSGERPWSRNDEPKPLSAYGRSKLVGEKQVCAAGGRFVILRTSWVFSSFGANFLKTMLRLAQNHRELKVVCDQIGGPTPAADIARACLSICSQLADDDSKSGTYHFSGFPNVSWADYARAIFRATQTDVIVHDIPASDYPTPAARPLNSRLDCRETIGTFGLEPPDWREAILQIARELESER